MNPLLAMRRIGRADIEIGERLISVEMSYPEFVRRFGDKHSDHPADWDAPGPVELWFFELPWGHKITIERHKSIDWFNIYLESLEIEAVLDFLELRAFETHVEAYMVDLLRARYPVYTKDLGPCRLFRLDDNGNRILMHEYESRRVADYYQRVYEARGHKQLYWVECAEHEH
ncbi:hypothetical protein SAMN05518845_109180 [Variovorax sp. YR750]|uniref:hypothetical protein n=1 Tax=Variovorax sp. YR750 TaxID=1884384 RepID=UPI0008D17EB0|nr:hypothetical protein [Variovorax sp. YR750]SEL64286.1 hypothetical protein SAMN05518845_109180 [Variovorax sp. YR750]